MRKESLRKFAVNCARTVIVGLIILITTFCVGKYNNYQDIKNNVEPYCAVRYSHDVEEYKACKTLNSTQLLHKLTEQEKAHNKFDVVSLPTLSM